MLHKILLRTTKYYTVLLRTTQYYPVLQSTRQYYSVLHSTSPYYKVLLRPTQYYTVLLRTTKYYSVPHSTTPYYKVLLRTTKYCTVLLRTTTTQYYTVQGTETPWRCKTQCNCDIHIIPFAEHWNVQYNARSNSWNLKFAFRYSFARSTHRILREGSSSKIKMSVSLQRPHGAQSRIYTCTFRYSGVRKNVWNKWPASTAPRGIQKSLFHHSFRGSTTTKWRKGSRANEQNCISPQFWTYDVHCLR